MQWAASLSGYADAEPGLVTAILLPGSGAAAPVLQPTTAILQTDRGPIELSVAMASNDEHDTLWGTTRLDMFLPDLDVGTYRAEFLDLTDTTGTWRYGIGRVVIRVEPGAPPTDLVRTGGTYESVAAEGGSVQGFDVVLQNTTDDPIEVTGATTDIPGLPVQWLLIDPRRLRVLDAVAIPGGDDLRVTVGTASDAKPVSFVVATPEIMYRIGGADRRVLVDPIMFMSGFGGPSDVGAYRATLPASACAERR